jgi:hypothetical protein
MPKRDPGVVLEVADEVVRDVVRRAMVCGEREVKSFVCGDFRCVLENTAFCVYL